MSAAGAFAKIVRARVLLRCFKHVLRALLSEKKSAPTSVPPVKQLLYFATAAAAVRHEKAVLILDPVISFDAVDVPHMAIAVSLKFVSQCLY